MKIIDKYEDKIKGILSTFDRIIFKGHIRQLFGQSGKNHFLSQENVLLKDFAAYAEKITESICINAKKIAEEAGKSVIYLNSPNISKEKTVLEIIEKEKLNVGLVCVLSTIELCISFEVRKNMETGKLHLINRDRKCKYLYFYYLDQEFGLMHVKLQTWFPFEIQVYINGREYLARQLDREGIKYIKYDNSLIEIEDIKKAQEMADKIDSRKLYARLDSFAHRVNPFLNRITEIFSCGYFWSINQCEYATDIMFTSREALETIYPDLVGQALNFNCDDVMMFLGRKMHNAFQGEIVSDMKIRRQGIRIKHRMKSNNIKMYDKYSVLRIETTINDPHEFKIYKEVKCKGDSLMKWVPMGKSIANIYRYAQISEASNKRYMDALLQAEDTGESIKEIERLCARVENGGKRYSGFNPLSKESTEIFHAILDGRNHINGFTNKDIRKTLFPDSSKDDIKVRNRVTRLFAKLRAHKLISKIPHSTRYKITRRGVRLMVVALKIKNKDYPKLAGAA